MGIGLKWFTLY